MEGVFKLNFDGSSKGNPVPGGFGCVVRDSRSNVVRAFCGALGGCNLIKAEAMALLMGLREWQSMGAHGCIVEGIWPQWLGGE